MRFLNFAALPLTLASLCILPGCMDDKYDLSDVDTTVEVKVNDLVLPLNIDPITLDNVFDLKEGDRIQVVDGYYAVLESGDFNTSDIEINTINLNAPVIDSGIKNLSTSGAASSRRKAAGDLSVALSVQPSAFQYSTNDVNESIVSIEEIGTDFTFDIKISFPELRGVISKGELTNLSLLIPKGLTVADVGATYNPETGVYTLPSVPMQGNSADIRIKAKAFNAGQADVRFDYDTHTVDFDGEVALLDGRLEVKQADMLAAMPSNMTMRVDYKMSDIIVTSFTGEMQYDITNTSFTDVDLSDLPDFLAQEGTDIRIVNPQLYLDIYNPLAPYSLYVDSDLEIKSYGRDDSVNSYTLDNGAFRVKGSPADSFVKLCLSPSVPSKWYEGFAGATHVPYSSLSNVLSGNGIPSKLSVNLINPIVPRQKVKDFTLGVKVGDVHGRYTFFAPLNLKAGSSVVYSKTETGWGSEDLDAVTIQTLEVNVNVSTDIPLGVHFTGYPIDKNGNRINNVNIEGAELQPNAKDQAVKIYITGEVKGLDGIEFVATATASDSSAPLDPDMNIVLTNLKAKVSGFYNKKL